MFPTMPDLVAERAGEPAVIGASELMPATVAPIPLPPAGRATYRVFRHDGLGLHFVLRDVAELAGYTCVYGPTADGRELTFPQAVAFANRAFTEWSRSERRFSIGEPASAVLAGLQMQAAEMPVLFGV